MSGTHIAYLLGAQYAQSGTHIADTWWFLVCDFGVYQRRQRISAQCALALAHSDRSTPLLSYAFPTGCPILT
eukprot:1757913-Rhodomonas_salina.2